MFFNGEKFDFDNMHSLLKKEDFLFDHGFGTVNDEFTFWCFTVSKGEQNKRFRIICPRTNSFPVYVKYDEQMNMEELELANSVIIDFICEMTKLGYIY